MAAEGSQDATGAVTTEEFVPDCDRVIWQSEQARSYYCETCRRWVHSQNETYEVEAIECVPGGHRVIFMVRRGGT